MRHPSFRLPGKMASPLYSKQYFFSNRNMHQSLAYYLGYIPEKQCGWRELWC